MLKRFKFHLMALASTAAIMTGAAQADGHNPNIIAFGGSETDVGNVNIPGFAQAPIGGASWIRQFADHYGKTMVASSSIQNAPNAPLAAGANNFAWAGSQLTGQNNTVPAVPAIATFPALTAQVTRYLGSTGGVADSKALYAIWTGTNDVINYMGTFVAQGPVVAAGVFANTVAKAGTTIATQLRTLHTVGARKFLVFNIPDVGKSPAFVAAGAQTSASATAVSKLENSLFMAGLAALPFDVIVFDVASFLNYMLENPTAFGFANSNAAFADGLNLNAAASRILGDAAFSVVQAPYYLGTMAESSLNQMAVYENVINGSTGKMRVCKCGDGRFVPIVSVAFDYFKQNGHRTSLPGYTSKQAQVIVGGHVNVLSNLNLGFVIGQSLGKNHFSQHGGHFELDQTRAVVFATLNTGPLFWSADFHASYLNLRKIKRHINLNGNHFHTGANTDGRLFGGKVETGFWVARGGAVHSGPIAQFTFQDGSINEFKEHSLVPGLGLQIFKQNFRTSGLGLGWELRYHSQCDTEFWTRLMALVEKRPHRHVDARVSTLEATSFATKISEISRRPWARFEAGVNTVAGKRFGVGGGLLVDVFRKTHCHHHGGEHHNSHAVSAMLKVTF